MDVLFLMSICGLYPGLKISFENISVCKNLLQSACFRWDSRLSLREMDQKLKFDGTIGYGDSYLEFVFRHLKVFRLHTILNDAAAAVRAHSGKGRSNCYMIGWGRDSCLLGHVTGLLFCLYVNFILPSIFDSVDFWSSMSCIVLDFESADKTGIKELGVFSDGKVQGYSFRFLKMYKPTKQAFWCTRNVHRIVWNSGRLDNSELSNVLLRAENGGYFAKETEKCKILGNLLHKEVENLIDHGCAKIQDLVDEEIGICSSYPFRHRTTLHCDERTAKLFGGWIMRHLML